MPTVPELIKKKLKTETLSKPQEGGGRTIAGNLKMKDIEDIAKEKGDTSKPMIRMIVGTCVSCGVTIDGKDPKEVIKTIA
jgi:large subunit ribosomal protein L11